MKFEEKIIMCTLLLVCWIAGASYTDAKCRALNKRIEVLESALDAQIDTHIKLGKSVIITQNALIKMSESLCFIAAAVGMKPEGGEK